MNILAIGAHHDDIELGCAGTLAKLLKQGHNVFGIVLTDSVTHYDLQGIYRTKNRIQSESREAASFIGLELVDLDFPLAKNGFLIYNVELMRELETFIVKQDITTVFSHWKYDMNTDHKIASEITIVASRHVKNVLMYRSNWYQPDKPFNGMFFCDISETMNLKIECLKKYVEEVDNRSEEWINSFIDMNRTYGFSIGVDYAEIFQPVRYII